VAEALELEESEVQEVFFERGWTDGLPIVAPTIDRVEAMLGAGSIAPDAIVGSVPSSSRTLTAEKLAISAVMAGCRPAYFPVVLAAAGAMLDPAFNVNTVVTSTGGAAVCTVVSGPVAAEIGMNAGHNALGPGNRANATIGRTLRLLSMNVLGSKPGGLDGSSLGTPAKYTLCFAEQPPAPPWEPLHVALGFDAADTTVTLVATEGPHQIANHLNGDPAGIVATIAAAIANPASFPVGKGGQGVVVLGPEHGAAIIGAGWSRERVQAELYERSRITPDALQAAGIVIETGAQHDMTPGPDGKLPSLASPDDVIVVTAGVEGGGWSAWMPSWAPKLHSRAVTKAVTKS
jgi:hypothetical protein